MGVLSVLNSAGNIVLDKAMDHVSGKSTSSDFGMSKNSGSGSFTGLSPASSVPNTGSDAADALDSNDSASAASYLPGAASLLKAGGSVVGGLLNYFEQRKVNKEARRQFNEALAFAKDQFYNAAQHRVADAAKAGIHPLAALGINPHGSASPTVHGQSATGLGHALQTASGAVQQYLDNRIRSAEIDLIDSQVVSNKALAVKHAADAGRSLADTDLARKDLANYHVYRGINSVINGIGSIGRLASGFFRRSASHPTVHYNYNSNPTFQRIY